MPHQSTRKKKALDRYSDYVLYRMTDKTHLDSRLQSLARLVRSGVLCEVDNDTAYRLVEAFCFKRYILTLSQTRSFRLFQIQSVGRRQF